MRKLILAGGILATIVILALLRGCQPPKPIQPLVVYTTYLPMVTNRYNPKRGVVNLSNCADVKIVGAAWTYVYYPIAPNCPGIENVPMIQSESQMSVPVSGNSEWILGFNEPDMPGWAQQTPAQGAQNWRIVEQMYPDKYLASPVPVSGTNYDPLNWLRDFRNEYVALYGSPPRMDALAVHVYFVYPEDPKTSVLQSIQLARDWGIGEVWITEWGMPHGTCKTDSADLPEISKFMRWMDTEPKITKYAWFGTALDLPADWYPPLWCDLSLVKDGNLTLFGIGYR